MREPHVQRGDLQNETCLRMLDWKQSSPNREGAGMRH